MDHESYRVVVPSRQRVRNMRRLLALLPDATVCVAKSEADEYAEVVPRKQLLLHDDLPNLVSIRNWLNQAVQERCLVEIDDDLRCVYALVGKRRKITDPDTIRDIIANSVQVASDLDIGVFCWNRTQNTAISDPIFQPIRFVMPVSSSFGLRGRARERKFDSGFPGRADFDFTLTTLLEDRILYADCRFYFDHGRIFSGLGGNVGLISSEEFQAGTERLHQKWGRYLSTKKPSWQKGARNVQAMSIRVRRQNPLASGNLR